MTKSYLPIAAAALLLTVTAPSAAPPAAEKQGEAQAGEPSVRPGGNIVLITVDSLRTDRLGCYAPGRDDTPSIDRLAERGVRFTRAYTASVSTAPANASIITGRYPSAHGLRHDLGGRLAEEVETVAQRLRRAGFATGAVVGSFHLDADRGLDRGFDSYDDDNEGLVKLIAGRSFERRADQVIEAANRWLQGVPADRPFFLWINFYDPHYDYEPPAHLREKYESDPYQGEVAHVDAQVESLSRVLRARKAVQTTHVILAGSHGEGLGGDGETGHGVYLDEETIGVPLIIAPAGSRANSGVRVDAPVSLVDLMPTMLDLAGVEAPAGLDGLSLEPLLWKGKEAAPPAIAADRKLFVEAVQPHEAYGWGALFAVLQGDRKIVSGEWVEAFQLGAGRSAGKPISPLPGWARKLETVGRAHLGDLEPPAAEKKRLEAAAIALKLPWDNSPICLEKQDWPDPRRPEHRALSGKLFKARIDSDQLIIGRAAISANEVLESEPVNFTALDLLLRLWLSRGYVTILEEPLELFQCNYPYRPAPYHYYAHYLEMLGDLDGAQRAYELFGTLEPWSSEVDYDLAALYAQAGDKEKAFTYLERSIDRGADHFDLMWRDPRLGPLMTDPRFTLLVGPQPGAETPPEP